jgi:hypothetical protein
MPRTAITPQQVTRAAITPTYGAGDAVNGHQYLNGGSEFIHVKTGATGTTVTVNIPKTVDGQAVTNKTYVLGTNTERMIGPFPPDTYNQADGNVYIDLSSAATVTLAVIRGS